MHIYLKMLLSIQTRTSPPKIYKIIFGEKFANFASPPFSFSPTLRAALNAGLAGGVGAACPSLLSTGASAGAGQCGAVGGTTCTSLVFQ